MTSRAWSHPDRVGQWTQAHIEDLLDFREQSLCETIIQLCQSHAWDVWDDKNVVPSQRVICRIPRNVPVNGAPLNLQYLACCLRLGDAMDFDRSRTPLLLYREMDFATKRSWLEWNKHLQVGGWSITSREVMFSASCSHPMFYVAVHEHLALIDRELRDCRLLVEEAPSEVAARYQLQLPHAVDRRCVRMSEPDCVAGHFRFRLEYDEIMHLLMDKSLYPVADRIATPRRGGERC